MAWSEGKNILGRGHRRDKDSEGLVFFVFCFFSRAAIGILAGTVRGHCPLLSYTARGLCPFPT